MRRVVDVVLITLVLAGIAVGALEIGRAVTNESETAQERSAGSVNGTTTTTGTGTGTTASAKETDARNRRDLEILVAKIGVAGVAALALLTTVSSLRRHRRRERWHR